eukprot:1393327-Amorphochlora_amoeboformis.AAC.1
MGLVCGVTGDFSTPSLSLTSRALRVRIKVRSGMVRLKGLSKNEDYGLYRVRAGVLSIFLLGFRFSLEEPEG